jgi:hypothetical protein
MARHPFGHTVHDPFGHMVHDGFIRIVHHPAGQMVHDPLDHMANRLDAPGPPAAAGSMRPAGKR